MNLVSFKIFESQAGIDFRFPLSLPENESELSKINSLPEFKTLTNIIGDGVSPKFKLNKSGSLELFLNKHYYEFKLTRSGKLYYGSYPVGPTTKFEIKNWGDLIDFISVYFTSKRIGCAVNLIDSFVFDGSPISPSIIAKLKKVSAFSKIVDLAKKYNSPYDIDKTIENLTNQLDRFILDSNKIVETETYKFLQPIFDLETESTPGDSIQIKFNHYSPYGILDGISETRIYDIYTSVGPDGDIKVKTLRGLEKSVKSMFRNRMVTYPRNPIALLKNKMIDFIMDNIGNKITKDIIIEKFKGDIKDSTLAYLKSIIMKYNSRNLDKPEFLQQLVASKVLLNLVSGETDTDSILSDLVKEDPTVLSKLEELDKKLYDRILKNIGWDKMGPDLLRQLKMGLI
jgi:hypothetical protein